jgi:hypothetical protein
MKMNYLLAIILLMIVTMTTFTMATTVNIQKYKSVITNKGTCSDWFKIMQDRGFIDNSDVLKLGRQHTFMTGWKPFNFESVIIDIQQKKNSCKIVLVPLIGK